MNRREFMVRAGGAIAGARLVSPLASVMAQQSSAKKMRLAVVGTGVRGVNTYGKELATDYSDYVEFVGLCDPNPSRLNFAKEYIGVNCPTFTDFATMVKQTKPDKVVVTTVDAYHNKYIVKGMDSRCRKKHRPKLYRYI